MYSGATPKIGCRNYSTLAITITNFGNINRSAITFSNMRNAGYENVFHFFLSSFLKIFLKESLFYISFIVFKV